MLDLAGIVSDTGWRILPCDPERKKPLIDGGTGFCNASDDLAVVEGWCRQFNPWMYGIPTGQMNDLVVLDVDVHDAERNGYASLKMLEAKGMVLPETLRVKTPSGGMHWYFANPKDADIRNSAGKIAPGLDIRGNGGYVIGVGSVNAKGQAYLPDNEADIAEMPRWLVDLCLKGTTEAIQGKSQSTAKKFKASLGSTVRKVNDPQAYLNVAFFNCCLEVERAEKGSRNSKLFRNAKKLFSYAAGGMLSVEDVEDAMRKACILNDYTAEHGEKSFLDTLNSGKRWGFKNPEILERGIAND